MPTINTLAAQLIRRASGDLARIVTLTAPDRLEWSPLDEGRTVLDQVIEVAKATEIGARTLEARGRIKLDPREFDEHKAKCATIADALASLSQATDRIVAVIEAFPPQHWDDTINLPFGEGVDRSFAELAMMHYWHMTYHYAQIAYIQTLYGDKESW